jgi:uncharacterized protein YndB with AHSA1/START domain
MVLEAAAVHLAAGSLVSGHSLRHAVNIAADHGKVRTALSTLDGLKGWTMAEVSGGGGVGSNWSLKYPGGPTFVWEITAQDDHKISWKCVEGPGDSTGTTVTFNLGTTPHGRVHLTFDHAGWPRKEGNFDKCNSLWGMMLHHLRSYVEKGKVAPAYS